MRLPTLLGTVLVGISAGIRVSGYEVPVSDQDDTRQACSGMYGGSNAKINVTFEANSRGQLAMVIYEWSDAQYLGKITALDEDLPKTYICTSDAVNGGYCGSEELGRFIIDLPNNKQLNSTSIWSRRIVFSSSSNQTRMDEAGNGFWDNPAGNPTPPVTDYASPWRRAPTPVAVYTGDEDENDEDDGDFHIMDTPAPTPSATSTPSLVTKDNMVLNYQEPIIYPIQKTGYYCVAVVPLTVTDMAKRSSSDVPNHPTFKGTILFQNIFSGQLQAADYPKINFYLGLMLAYVVIGAVWGYMCFQHQADLLPIQYYISYLLGFLVIEMMANWGYYRFVNAHGAGVSTTAFLIVVAILDAGRNALSFFLLLVVSLGLSVVRENLGPIMRRCTILAALHFIFGVLYAIGLVELDLGSTAGVVLLMFVMPLAFTLSAFLLWIMHALTGTINELKQRKQRYKLRMFRRLQFILIAAVLIIAVFFVVSTMSFSDRLDENFAPSSWRWRWWLIDGYLALLYLAVFVSTAYLWRPTGSNRRLAMSDELAQDEEDAEDYDLDNLEERGQPHPLNADGVPEAPRSSRRRVGEDELVFEIGDDEDDEDGRGRTPMSKRVRQSGEEAREEHEQEGLMGAQR